MFVDRGGMYPQAMMTALCALAGRLYSAQRGWTGTRKPEVFRVELRGATDSRDCWAMIGAKDAGGAHHELNVHVRMDRGAVELVEVEEVR